LIAAISHHGKPGDLSHRHSPALWTATAERDPFAGATELMRRIEAWFPEAFLPGGEPLPAVPAFQHAFSGLVMLADWLGSDTHLFPFFVEGEGDRMVLSRRLAAKALVRIGLDAEPARFLLGTSPVGFDRISDFSPRAAQAAVMDLPLPRSSGLDILEAETGAGKTEAALARYLALFQAGAVDGLYFALPTRTAATQIHGRVVEAVARAFRDSESRPPVVLAVPGYLTVDDQEGRRLPGFEVLWNDDEKERLRFRGWAAEHPKRYLAGPIVVGTIDQILLSTLAVNHSHMRATALLRHLIVVDEVHASDAYMNRLLEAVLARHLTAGGHAFLMSATLGSTARDRFLKVADGETPGVRFKGSDRMSAVAFPYPAITHWSPERGMRPVDVPDPGNPKRVRVRLEPWAADVAAIASHALEAAKAGARVLVLRNTVRECLETQEAVERLAASLGCEELLFTCKGHAAPHHSRYVREDRAALDEAIEARIGKGAPDGGVVVVATQTVQQSLDLDADLLLSDLCPMDVLLQRIGRLHRHAGRRRPLGFASPAPIIVMTPEERDLGSLIDRHGRARGKHGIGSVYDDLRILEATWRELEVHPTIEVPRDCRVLVEATTHPDALAEIVRGLDGPWPAHDRALTGALTSDRRLADLNLANWTAAFGTSEVLFPAGELGRRIQTRLGEGDRLVAFEPLMMSPFGHPVRSLTIAAHFATGVSAEALPTAVETIPGGFDFTFGPKRFRYDRLGLRPLTTAPDPTEDDEADA
jgi:CRISPR-associated endonuclease/helicase Cas3